MILESDALQIVQALKIDVPNKNKYGYLIQNTQRILNRLHKWQVHIISQNLIGTIHRLAKEVLYMREKQCFL
jgi:hypothetical protein